MNMETGAVMKPFSSIKVSKNIEQLNDNCNNTSITTASIYISQDVYLYAIIITNSKSLANSYHDY